MESRNFPKHIKLSMFNSACTRALDSPSSRKPLKVKEKNCKIIAKEETFRLSKEKEVIYEAHVRQNNGNKTRFLKYFRTIMEDTEQMRDYFSRHHTGQWAVMGRARRGLQARTYGALQLLLRHGVDLSTSATISRIALSGICGTPSGSR